MVICSICVAVVIATGSIVVIVAYLCFIIIFPQFLSQPYDALSAAKETRVSVYAGNEIRDLHSTHSLGRAPVQIPF